jgi:predicted lipid-binding transport protein (Tim44 family)
MTLDDLLLARVGGGEGYSGGGGGGGGGYGGGGGGDGGDLEAIFFLIRLCIAYPQVGVPLTIVVVTVVVLHRRSQATQHLGDRPRVRRAAAASAWQRLAAADPRFSRVVLLDFLTRLFVRFQYLRGEGDVDALGPYLAPKVLEDLRAAQAQSKAAGARVVDVVLGGVEVAEVDVAADGAASLVVRYELNESLQAKDGTIRRYFARQTWRLDRAAGARSPEPEAARTLGCPSCGAPMRYGEQNRCAHCDTVVDAGRFTWRVTGVALMDRRPLEDHQLRLPSGGVERGTTLPDVVDARLPAARAAFEQRYPGFDWAAFEQHVRRAFLALQAAWTARSWQQARPFETDTLFHSHRFHLDSLVRRGLHNRVEQVQVRRVTVVRVESDAFYDAITARIHASTIDVTVDPQGKVLAGSATKPRSFSEYWTFVRSAGFEAPKAPVDPQGCPSCGASLELNQAGDCVHCGNTVTTGRFGWVLSAIEQDEAYAG